MTQRIIGSKVKSLYPKDRWCVLVAEEDDGTEITCKMIAQQDLDFLKMIIHDSNTWDSDSDSDYSKDTEEENGIQGENISIPLSHSKPLEITN